MSLNYSLTRIKDYQSLYTQDNEYGEDSYTLSFTTEELIFATLSVGLNGITEKNAVEFWVRLALIQKFWGTFKNLTPQDVKRHIGLHTNATNYKSRRKWTQLILDGECRRIEWNVRDIDWSDNDNVETFTLKNID